MNEQLEPVVKILRQWLVTNRVGNVTVNFFKGGISSLTINETLKIKEVMSNDTEKDSKQDKCK